MAGNEGNNREWKDGPVGAGCDEAGAFLVAPGVLGGLNDELEGVVHWESKRGLIRLCGFYTPFVGCDSHGCNKYTLSYSFTSA
jgi:hypothetical protein